jgi:hypothetical protein
VAILRSNFSDVEIAGNIAISTASARVCSAISLIFVKET